VGHHQLKPHLELLVSEGGGWGHTWPLVVEICLGLLPTCLTCCGVDALKYVGKVTLLWHESKAVQKVYCESDACVDGYGPNLVLLADKPTSM